MRSSKEWADEIIHHIRRVRSEVELIPKINNTAEQPVQSAQTGMADGASIAMALSEYCRNDNSVTQTLAIRLSNLAAKYPQRAA